MRGLALFLFVVFFSAGAAAAPMWIERRATPEPALIATVFAQSSNDSETIIEHAAWDKFLSQYVVPTEAGVNLVRYGDVSEADKSALRAYIRTLSAVDLPALARPEQLAFWINLYNAATVALILEHYPTRSIRRLDEPWDSPAVTVNGQSLSLGDIEHRIIRPLFPDPRIHYALNCAAIGCPNLAVRAYRGETIDAALDDAARSYVNSPRGVRIVNDTLRVSKIYGWYREDFGGSQDAVLVHLRQYAEPDLIEALAKHDRIDRYNYNWSLNDADVENEKR